MDSVLYVQQHGVGLYRHTDNDGTVVLRAYPVERLTIRLKAFIRDYRDDILALLETPDLDRTVGNILALPPAELEEYRALVAATGPDEDHYDHDTEALRRAEAVIAKREASAAAIRLEKAS